MAFRPEASAVAESTLDRTRVGKSGFSSSGIEGGIGSDGQGDGGVHGLGRPGEEEQGLIQEWATRQEGNPERYKRPGPRHVGTTREEMEDVLHEARAMGTVRGRGKLEAMVTNLDEENIVEDRRLCLS